MTKAFNQFQNDVSGTANSLMTQLICAERGINYAQLNHMAEQAHVNSILQAEQQRQMNQVINRHYQGDSFVGKIRNLVGGQQSNFLAPQPQVFGMPMAQPVFQPQVAQPAPFAMQAGFAPQQLAQFIGQQPAPQPVQQQTSSLPDMETLTALITNVVSQLVPQQQAPSMNQASYMQQPVPPFYQPAPNEVAGEQKA